MFETRRNRSMLAAAFSTLSLIYHVSVNNLRRQYRDPVLGLVIEAGKSVLMMAGFMAFYLIFGVRTAPLRGDFVLFVFTGIGIYTAHVGAVSAVAGASSAASAILRHQPLTTAALIAAGALTALYKAAFSALIILGAYWLYEPYRFESTIGVMGMVLAGWGSGCAVGLVFQSVSQWSAPVGTFCSMFYARANMIASGKMFVANALPNLILAFFDWNPLFHIIDQARGYAFINYSPHNSSLMYPFYVALALAMIGLMAEFFTRQRASASWFAAR